MIKEKYMKKLKRISVLILAIIFALALASCGALETERGNEIKAKCEAMVEALIAGDENAAYAIFPKEMDRNEFGKSFPKLKSYVEGVETFELTQTGWHTGMENGVSYYKATFNMSTNKGNFTIEAMEVEGYDGIYNFRIINNNEYENYTGTITKMQGASPFQWGLIVFSALCLGFVVWMLVDCIKRKMKYKVLWIFLILCGAFVFTVNLGQNGTNFNATIAVMLFSYSYLQVYASGAAILKLTLPAGAVAYLIARKKFTIPEKAEAEYTLAEGAPTEEASTHSEENSENAEERENTEN